MLILDEATSSLDVPSERLVQQGLQTILADRTAVIIAHRLSTVEIADRVLVLEHGRVVEDGSPAELVDVATVATPPCTRPGPTRWPELALTRSTGAPLAPVGNFDAAPFVPDAILRLQPA